MNLIDLEVFARSGRGEPRLLYAVLRAMAGDDDALQYCKDQVEMMELMS